MGTSISRFVLDVSDELRVAVTVLDQGIDLPSYARDGDAGLDLASTEDLDIAPGGVALVPTGVALALPKGTAGLLMPRSGLAYRNQVTVLNAPGLIDSGYRDELKVLLVNHHRRVPFHVRRFDRIAQLVVQRVVTASLEPVDELSETERGSGGFGSTGVAS